MSKSSGHEIFISAAFFKTLATVLLDTLQLFAMFRSLNPKLCKRRISRYLSIIVTSFTYIHTNGVYLQYKGNICNKAFKCGSELPEHVALILRNGGSESPGIISSVSAQKNKIRKFIAIKTEDGIIKRKLAFYCRMLHVSRQGFYKYLSAKDHPWKYQMLANAILEIHAEDICNDTYGVYVCSRH